MLSDTMRVMLDACIGLMTTGGENRGLDFFPLRGELRGSRGECIAYLAAGLEGSTNGQRTVREVHHNAFSEAPMGISNLFLAVCDASTPTGQVANLTDSMDAYIIAPGKGWGCVRAQRK